MPIRSSLPVLLLVVALALAVACGDSDGTPDPSPSATAAATSGPSATATPEPSATSTATATAPPIEPTATTGVLAIEDLPLVEFTSSDGTVATLPIEIPPRDEYGIGLSGRYELGERGMLFHYPDAETARAFYMKNTHIDLDIAFIGADFQVQEILTMEAESLDIRRPSDPYQYAIEAPAGWYASNGIGVGDEARFAFELDDFS